MPTNGKCCGCFCQKGTPKDKYAVGPVAGIGGCFYCYYVDKATGDSEMNFSGTIAFTATLTKVSQTPSNSTPLPDSYTIGVSIALTNVGNPIGIATGGSHPGVASTTTINGDDASTLIASSSAFPTVDNSRFPLSLEVFPGGPTASGPATTQRTHLVIDANSLALDTDTVVFFPESGSAPAQNIGDYCAVGICNLGVKSTDLKLLVTDGTAAPTSVKVYKGIASGGGSGADIIGTYSIALSDTSTVLNLNGTNRICMLDNTEGECVGWCGQSLKKASGCPGGGCPDDDGNCPDPPTLPDTTTGCDTLDTSGNCTSFASSGCCGGMGTGTVGGTGNGGGGSGGSGGDGGGGDSGGGGDDGGGGPSGPGSTPPVIGTGTPASLAMKNCKTLEIIQTYVPGLGAGDTVLLDDGACWEMVVSASSNPPWTAQNYILQAGCAACRCACVQSKVADSYQVDQSGVTWKVPDTGYDVSSDTGSFPATMTKAMAAAYGPYQPEECAVKWQSGATGASPLQRILLPAVPVTSSGITYDKKVCASIYTLWDSTDCCWYLWIAGDKVAKGGTNKKDRTANPYRDIFGLFTGEFHITGAAP